MADYAQFFHHLFRNAKRNAMLVMRSDGVVEEVNEAFTHAFGWTNEALRGRHYRILFTEEDEAKRRPETELETTLDTGSCSDENYLVASNGHPVWVTGETVLIPLEEGTCIVKVIHSLHAQKQLERYLLASSELLENLLESVSEYGLILLDSGLRVLRSNTAFQQMFSLPTPPEKGARLADIQHPIWQDGVHRAAIRDVLVRGENCHRQLEADGRRFSVTFKNMVLEQTLERNLLLAITAKD